MNIAEQIQLATRLVQSKRYEEATVTCELILSRKPRHHGALYLLSLVAFFEGRNDEALNFVENVLALNPSFAEAYNLKGSTLLRLGEKDKAIGSYLSAIQYKPDYADAHSNLAYTDPRPEQIPVIEQLLEQSSGSGDESMLYEFTLGRLYNKKKQYAQSFHHYQRANAIKRKSLPYNSETHSNRVSRISEAYSAGFFESSGISGSKTQLPVFIVGMPRSGTSLVEQILSSHPLVCGAGELSTIEQIEFEIIRHFSPSHSYPACIGHYTTKLAREHAGHYLNKLISISNTARRITDKMPQNFLALGLIKLLFPNARIIHCQRDPLDTCTSIFMNYFPNGNAYSFDLNDLGHYYLDYFRLMQHWESLFPDEILHVKYESLVDEPEQGSRKIVEHLGLDWDESCLKFHENTRAVRTASNIQVRNPVYKDSVGRWKRYERELQPLADILNPILAPPDSGKA